MEQTSGPPLQASNQPGRLPWEDPGRGLLEGLFSTIGLFVTEPHRAFEWMSRDAGLGRPFFYALIMNWVALAAGFVFFFLLQLLPGFTASMPELDEAMGAAAIGTGVMVAIFVGIAVFMPVFLVIGLAIHSCVIHLMLVILGEGKGGFETTVRLLCYASTAQLANVLPFCGGLVQLLWSLFLQVVGIARAHRCSYGTAVLAVLLPVFLCCGCIAGVIALAISAGVLGSLDR